MKLKSQMEVLSHECLQVLEVEAMLNDTYIGGQEDNEVNYIITKHEKEKCWFWKSSIVSSIGLLLFMQGHKKYHYLGAILLHFGCEATMLEQSVGFGKANKTAKHRECIV